MCLRLFLYVQVCLDVASWTTTPVGISLLVSGRLLLFFMLGTSAPWVKTSTELVTFCLWQRTIFSKGWNALLYQRAFPISAFESLLHAERYLIQPVCWGKAKTSYLHYSLIYSSVLLFTLDICLFLVCFQKTSTNKGAVYYHLVFNLYQKTNKTFFSSWKVMMLEIWRFGLTAANYCM